MSKEKLYIFDTTLRDGAQTQGVHFSIDEKTKIAHALDDLGVDYIEFTPNPSVRKKLNRIGLQEVGDISWPEHLGIFTIPVQVAVNYKIPLIVWGENSQNEYGGPAVAKDSKILNRQWLEEFGGLLGLRTRDMSDSHGIDTRDLMPYTYPTDEELEKVGVSGIFLGYFIPWDGLSNALISSPFQTGTERLVSTTINRAQERRGILIFLRTITRFTWKRRSTFFALALVFFSI